MNNGSGWNSGTDTFRSDLRDPTGIKGALANGTIIPYHNGLKGLGNEPMPATYMVHFDQNRYEAVAALQAGEIDLIDSGVMGRLYWGGQSTLLGIDPTWGSILLELDLLVLELGFNMQHPSLVQEWPHQMD